MKESEDFIDSATNLILSKYFYKQSLPSNPNIATNILLQDMCTYREKYNKSENNPVINSVQTLLHDVDTSKSKTWTSSLSNFSNAEDLFKQTVSPCNVCQFDLDDALLNKFQSNECKCNLGIHETLDKKLTKLSSDNKTKSLFGKNINLESLSQEVLSGEEQRLLFKPRFSRPKQVTKNNNPMLSVNEQTIEVINKEKEDNDNRIHQSNVAKITFKTAKEQLLGSNPAAKRTLGASRKAQSKFVSPMIGLLEKQETSEPSFSDERLKHLDPKMVELIESEIIDKGAPIEWQDIAGLEMAKSVIQEAVVWPLLRPDIFTGLRRPPKGILLFGPPGTGKTLIGKCVAAQCRATFFSISASSLTSKWLGDGEKMVRALFAVARCHQPAVIFIDEIDSLLTQRSDSEHEATRRIKTEFLVQFDGAATEEDDRLLIVGATNRPQELDEAARRRLVKRLYIPLPDLQARKQIIVNLLREENNSLTDEEISEVASRTDGYSGADMKSLCSEAAMGPVRSVPLSQIASIHKDKVRPVCAQDFLNALQRVRPSVSQDDLGRYVKWNKTYGQGF